MRQHIHTGGFNVKTLQQRSTSSLSGFVSDTLGKLFPMVTLAVGYFFGVQSKKEGTKS